MSSFLGKYSLSEEEVVALRVLPLDNKITPTTELLAMAEMDASDGGVRGTKDIRAA